MASTKLTRTASGGSRTTWTISTWVKRGSLGSGLSSTIFDGIAGNTQNESQLLFLGDSIEFYDYTSSTRTGTLVTTAKYRDVNAWYHIVAVWDTTNATAGDRMRLYVNGEEVTSFATDTQPSLNQNSSLGNGTYTQQIGLYGSNSSYYFNGSMAHFHFIDGTAYDASTFGEFDAQNVWKPKTAPSVTYGTNGFFLKFANAGSLGTDSSGNGNDFTVNGTGTQTLDTPSNVFATFNPLAVWRGQTASPSQALLNGNTTYNDVPLGDDTYKSYGVSTLGVTKGKWYCEAKVGTITRLWLGVSNSTLLDYTTPIVDTPAYTSFGWYGNGDLMFSSSSQATSVFGGYVTDDILMFALDMDNYKFYVGKNGTWLNSGDPTSGATGTGSATEELTGSSATLTDYGEVFFFAGDNSPAGSASVFYNFGNGYFGTTAVSTPNADGEGYGKFEYSVPTGYYALCTKNIQTYG